jgi:hypothetical protein
MDNSQIKKLKFVPVGLLKHFLEEDWFFATQQLELERNETGSCCPVP